MEAKFNSHIVTAILSFYLITGSWICCAEECVKGFRKSEMSGMLIGVGEGKSYVDAKNAAMADAISVLGTKILAKSSTIESGSGSTNIYTDQTIESETDALVKGAKVLSDCQEGDTHKLTIGINKSLIASLIEAHGEQRTEWISAAITALESNPTSAMIRHYRDGYLKIQNEEKDDLDSWLVLGRPKELFKEVPADLRRTLEQKINAHSQPKVKNISIRATDEIAKQTLAVVMSHLAADGIEAINSESKSAKTAIWQCNLVKGMAVGQAVRFIATCSLTQAGFDFPPISVQGISVDSNIQDQAVRLVSQQLLAH